MLEVFGLIIIIYEVIYCDFAFMKIFLNLHLFIFALYYTQPLILLVNLTGDRLCFN